MKNRVKIKASELTDVDIDLISFVHRPSSRIPFGLMKSEKNPTGGNQMIDLQNIFKREETVPVVTSVIVKGEASAQMLELLKAEGFAVDEVQKQDDVSVYPQDVPYHGEVSVVKLSEDLAVTVPLIKGDGSFAEKCAQQGFYPSLNIGVELLHCELYRAVEKSDSPAAAANKVSAVVNDFGVFMSSLVGSLPTQVFKTEDAISKMEAAPVSQEAAEGTGEEAPAQEEQGGNAPAQADEGEGDGGTEFIEGEGEQVEKSEGDAGDAGETTGEEGGDEPAAPAIDIAALTASIAKSVTDAINPKLEELTEGLGGVTTRLDEVESIAKSAGEAAQGTVFNGVFKTDREAPVQKAEEDLPLLDTGFRLGKGA